MEVDYQNEREIYHVTVIIIDSLSHALQWKVNLYLIIFTVKIYFIIFTVKIYFIILTVAGLYLNPNENDIS
jgi:hypothetical protein